MPEFSIAITPRFYETDALGHINNAAIAAWMEVVRMEFIASLSRADSGEAQNWILASLQIDFIAETFFGDEVTANVTEAAAGNTSLTVYCELFQSQRLTVKSKAVVVYMNSATNTPERLPDALRERLNGR
ncbi:MAG: thioesterase family protein [Pseudomonadota bacterium]